MFERMRVMRKTRRMARTLGAAAALLAAAGLVAAQPSPTPTAAKSHARTAKGVVAAVAPDGKVFVVRDEHGKESRFVVTTATRFSGVPLETGRKVTVRWLHREKQNVATAVRVHAPDAERTASTTPSAAPNPNPTPNRP